MVKAHKMVNLLLYNIIVDSSNLRTKFAREEVTSFDLRDLSLVEIEEVKAALCHTVCNYISWI